MEVKNIEFSNARERIKKLHSTISSFANELCNINTISIVYGDHKNSKKNYSILKNILHLENLEANNFQVLQMVDKQIDKEHMLKSFLLKIKGKNKNLFKNVTAILKKGDKGNKLIHIHISEPNNIEGGTIIELERKDGKNYIGIDNKDDDSGNGVLNIDLLNTNIFKSRYNIDLNNPNDIAKSIMINYWAKALLLGPNEVVKLFSPDGFLKGTIVQHLSVGKAGLKDYFAHFCKRRPKMKIIDINSKWLKKGESILAYGEYIFNLSNPDQKVTGNFTMVFINKNNKWMIDGLHSSIKFGLEDLKKLN